LQVTFESKVKDASLYPFFDQVAALYGRVERSLYVDLYVRGLKLKELKQEYILKFGITARQSGAVAVGLKGKVKAARATWDRQERSLKRRIEATEKAVAELEKRFLGPGADKSWIRFLLHQKRRRIRTLQDRLARVEEELKRPAPAICFGGRHLFLAQHHLEENGYASHEAWLEAWRGARSSQFFCLGSKGESGGNQTATLLPDGTLRLRVPNALVGEFGHWVRIPDVRFPHGQDVIDAALASGQAITYRFVRKTKRGGPVWYIKASTERIDVNMVTHRAAGALGADLNPSLVTLGRIDRFGNPVETRQVPLDLRGRRRDQVAATLGDLVADIVEMAKAGAVPIVIERLDFEAKKARLREEGPRMARMLSSFAYHKFYSLILSRAAREGVEVPPVKATFTSVIGDAKFASGYGFSRHTAAAVAIARRGLGFGERLRSRSALPLPARTRGRHVWSDWGRVAQRQRAEKAHCRRPPEESHGRGTPLSSSAPAPRAPDKRRPTQVRPCPSEGGHALDDAVDLPGDGEVARREAALVVGGEDEGERPVADVDVRMVVFGLGHLTHGQHRLERQPERRQGHGAGDRGAVPRPARYASHLGRKGRSGEDST